MKQKVLLLGAGGFLGRHLCDYLLTQEGAYDVIEIGSSRDGFPPDRTISTDTAEHDIDRLIKAFAPNMIVNTIGVFSRSPEECFDVNALFPRVLMQSMKDTSIQLLLIGSAAEYGMVTEDTLPVREDQPLHPVSDYGISKAVQHFYMDSFTASHGCDIRLARVFNLIGKGLSSKLAPGGFAERIAKLQKDDGIQMQVGNLKQKRDYLGVHSACRMLEAIMMKGHPRETYNVCAGTSVEMETLLRTMLERAGMKDVTLQVDPALLKHADIPDIYGSTEKLQSLLDISQEELERTLTRDVDALLVGAGVTLVPL